MQVKYPGYVPISENEWYKRRTDPWGAGFWPARTMTKRLPGNWTRVRHMFEAGDSQVMRESWYHDMRKHFEGQIPDKVFFFWQRGKR